jgi:hypothetical protein
MNIQHAFSFHSRADCYFVRVAIRRLALLRISLAGIWPRGAHNEVARDFPGVSPRSLTTQLKAFRTRDFTLRMENRHAKEIRLPE